MNWFHRERAHVPVPGRGELDPYRIWVAEVMLQQTQVSTVWPYYTSWMETFPNVYTLAKADLDQVLKAWEGLGYYSRARNLHKGAGVIVSDWDGMLPVSAKELQKIPGIGPYTASAIASIAHGEAIPLIDGNVLRVITRLFQIGADVTIRSTRDKIFKVLCTLLPQEAPGAFNQSLMDLGRVICTPQDPECKACPLAAYCQAFKAGDMVKYPVKPKKAVTPHYTIVIGLIRKNGQLLIQKRPESGLLGGLWEFPGGKVESGETVEAALVREISEETGLTVTVNEKIGMIHHAYTHFKITMTAYFCDWQTGAPQINAATENRWVPPTDLRKFAFPKANLKILAILDW